MPADVGRFILDKASPGCDILILGGVELSRAATRTLRERRTRVTRLTRPQRFNPAVIDDVLGLPGDLDVASESMDMVIAAGWHETADFFRWSIQEVARVLRTGGSCVLCLPIHEDAALGFGTKDRFGLRNRLRRVRDRLQMAKPPAAREYPRIHDVISELGLQIDISFTAVVDRRWGQVSFSLSGMRAKIHDLGQSQVAIFLATKESPASARTAMLCDSARVRDTVLRDHGEALVALREFESKYSLRRVESRGSMALSIRARNALILSPHPDDELIGVGGTIMALNESRAETTILQMSNGRVAEALYGISPARQRTVRIREASKVAMALGSKLVCWSDIDEGAKLDDSDVEQLVGRLERLLLSLAPDAVFVPFVNDPHPDHVLANRVLCGAMDRWSGSASCVVFSYEVWSFCPYNTALDVSKWSGRKYRLIEEYRTALRSVNYARVVRLINTFHSFNIRNEPGEVEVFLSQSYEGFRQMVQRHPHPRLRIQVGSGRDGELQRDPR